MTAKLPIDEIFEILNKDINDTEKAAHCVFPEKSKVFVSSDGLYSPFCKEYDGAIIVFVPLDENRNITDDTRIVGALPTIKYLIDNGAKVILCSHMGKPKGEPKPELSLAPVAKALSEKLGKDVVFAADESGKMTMKTVQLVEGDDPNLIFKDTFSWANGPALCHSTSGEVRWDKCTNVERPEWTTTVYSGVYNEAAWKAAGEVVEDQPLFLSPAAWTRDGYIRLNAAKKPSNLVTPKLAKIEGTVNLEISFRACRYQSTKEPDGYHEIHVSCLGAGTVSTETFIVENCNNTDASVSAWNTLDESIYTFTVTGATSETQIEFHFGPRRDAADYNTNLSVTPDGEKNANTRMGFDDVVVMLAQ